MRCTPKMVSMERKNRVTARTKVAAGPFHVASPNEKISPPLEYRAARRWRLQGGGRHPLHRASGPSRFQPHADQRGHRSCQGWSLEGQEIADSGFLAAVRFFPAIDFSLRDIPCFN